MDVGGRQVRLRVRRDGRAPPQRRGASGSVAAGAGYCAVGTPPWTSSHGPEPCEKGGEGEPGAPCGKEVRGPERRARPSPGAAGPRGGDGARGAVSRLRERGGSENPRRSRPRAGASAEPVIPPGPRSQRAVFPGALRCHCGTAVTPRAPCALLRPEALPTAFRAPSSPEVLCPLSAAVGTSLRAGPGTNGKSSPAGCSTRFPQLRAIGALGSRGRQLPPHPRSGAAFLAWVPPGRRAWKLSGRSSGPHPHFQLGRPCSHGVG